MSDQKYSRLEAEEECNSDVLLCQSQWVCPKSGRILEADDIAVEDPYEYDKWRQTLLGI